MLRSLTLALGLAVGAPASAFIAHGGLTVGPAGPEGSHVSRIGASAFWWAADDSYAVRELRLPPATESYRDGLPVRRSGEGITFSFEPTFGQRTGLLRLQGGRSALTTPARTSRDGAGDR